MITIALPTADRPTAYRFYLEVFGFEPIGELAGDGVPEPLQFRLDAETNLMFVPTDGFSGVVGVPEVASPGVSECVLGLGADSAEEVDAVVAKARAAGARVVVEPVDQGWAYLGLFADPDGHLWQVIKPST